MADDEHLENWITQYAREQRERQEKVESDKFLLLNMLREKGIRLVAITYDGYGDSGEINCTLANDRTGAEVKLDSAIQDQLTNYAYELLGVNFPGWEINEGSFGEIRINPVDNKITYTHNTRVEQVETAEGEM